jgi:hypothetical protein
MPSVTVTAGRSTHERTCQKAGAILREIQRGEDGHPLLKGIAGSLLRFSSETLLATLAESDGTGQLYGTVHMRRARRS